MCLFRRGGASRRKATLELGKMETEKRKGKRNGNLLRGHRGSKSWTGSISNATDPIRPEGNTLTPQKGGKGLKRKVKMTPGSLISWSPI